MTESVFSQLNVNIFNTVNYFAGSSIVLDKFVIALAEYSPIIFVLVLLYLWFSKRENFALYSGYSAVVGLLLNFLISLLYFHPRPFMDHIGRLLISHVSETSFPSDHATFMLSVAFMFLYFKKTRKLGIVLSALGVIGGVARVYCGLHYPFDIVGSMIVAIFASGLVFTFKEKLQKFNNAIINLYFRVVKYGK